MVRTANREIVLPFGVDYDLHYHQDKVNVGLVDPDKKKPFHLYLKHLFKTEFEDHGDKFTVVGRHWEKFPLSATIGMDMVDDDLETEHRVGSLHGRHEKPRDHKKAVHLFTIPALPDNVSMVDDSLSKWMRHVMTRKPCHIGIMVEGEATDAQLRYGARAVVSTMEGGTQIITYDGDEQVFTHKIAQCLRLEGSVHMVTRKEGIRADIPTFEAWRTRPEVEEIAYNSRLLASAGHLWDLNLRDDASRFQVESILHTIKQAGLSEGNMSALVPDFAGRNAIMAMTETGINKTRIDPAKGEIVPVVELMPDGARYLILNGLPKGHPRTLARHPSQAIFVEVAEDFVSAFRRGRLREWFRNIPKKEIAIDHPFSVETFENAHAYRFMALREQGVVNSVSEYLQYLVAEHKRATYIPIIPQGVKIGPNAAIHTHETHKNEQSDNLIKVVPIELAIEDMDKLGFEHNPSCGSAESTIALLMQIDHSYELHGLPSSSEEVRAGHMFRHGIFVWSRLGPRKLAERYVNNMQLESHVRRAA